MRFIHRTGPPVTVSNRPEPPTHRQPKTRLVGLGRSPVSTACGQDRARRHPQHALPEQVNGYFAEMGRVAVELGNSAQEVLLTQDPDKAARIDEEDDAMDDLHRRVFSVLMDHEWKHGVAAAVDITLLGRFYERFADHTVEVARRVIFQSTGKSPQKTDWQRCD